MSAPRDDDRDAPLLPETGLCARCRHAQVITSARGAQFLLCRLSFTDPAFAKYPRLPVLRCRGYADTVVPV